jgi:hypothetical protein
MSTEERYTEEETARQAQGNTVALLLALLAYAKHRGDDGAAAARWVGERFAPTWDELQGKGAHAVARMAGLNLAAGGSAVGAVAGDAARAEVRASGWGNAVELALFGLDRGEADAFLDVFGPIAARLGLRYAWRREGPEAVKLVFEDARAAPAPLG